MQENLIKRVFTSRTYVNASGKQMEHKHGFQRVCVNLEGDPRN